jgi:hypothetical protein
VAPLEPWEKVLVDSVKFPSTVHGLIGCTTCHAGQNNADKEVAHTGLVSHPTRTDAQNTCGDCHPNVTAHLETNLHSTLQGYWTVLDTRAGVGVEGKERAHEMEEMFGNHCARCHASCGDCHVSQPVSVGGGFISGHTFNRTPSMTRNCTACHGSRVGNEYLGKNEGLRADVHFRMGRMSCVNCHGGAQMHGQPEECSSCHTGPTKAEVIPDDHRLTGFQSPSCESCHANAATGKDGEPMHTAHGSDLSCQVCHSISYSNCDSCHVALSSKTGAPFFETSRTYFGFFIGRNPLRSFARPYEFVPLRHVPADLNGFQFYGDDLLPAFDSLETWKYATPHNIQRITPQTQSCNACHGNPEWFLTADKMNPEELESNRGVIIENIPALLDEDYIPPGAAAP